MTSRTIDKRKLRKSLCLIFITGFLSILLIVQDVKCALNSNYTMFWISSCILSISLSTFISYPIAKLEEIRDLIFNLKYKKYSETEDIKVNCTEKVTFIHRKIQELKPGDIIRFYDEIYIVLSEESIGNFDDDGNFVIKKFNTMITNGNDRTVTLYLIIKRSIFPKYRIKNKIHTYKRS